MKRTGMSSIMTVMVRSMRTFVVMKSLMVKSSVMVSLGVVVTVAVLHLLAFQPTVAVLISIL